MKLLALARFRHGSEKSSRGREQELSLWTGLPVLGLDALASIGYGPEAALAILVLGGLSGLHRFPIVVLAIVAELALLSISYRQTISAYPQGGGAYVVAKENLGRQPGLFAGAALLVDYVLNVAVGISAGVGIVVSALPFLYSHRLAVCLAVLATLTWLNLRGVRQSGIALVGPVVVFIVSLGIVLAIGLIRMWRSAGTPLPVVPPAPLAGESDVVNAWFLLTAFANGCTAMTGIEVVSNGVNLFRAPKEATAKRALMVLTVVLAAYLMGIAYLCPAYHVGAMNEQQPSYRAVLPQLILAIIGKGVFAYITLASIFCVLTYSAQSSFAGFPRVCRFLAKDGFLPDAFAKQGQQLLPWLGITSLAAIAAVLLVSFGGNTHALIGLFAVGAFSAFLLDQFGMAKHWLRKHKPFKGYFNVAAACVTASTLLCILAAKFTEGAWIAATAIPAIVLLLNRMQRVLAKRKS